MIIPDIGSKNSIHGCAVLISAAKSRSEWKKAPIRPITIPDAIEHNIHFKRVRMARRSLCKVVLIYSLSIKGFILLSVSSINMAYIKHAHITVMIHFVHCYVFFKPCRWIVAFGFFNRIKFNFGKDCSAENTFKYIKLISMSAVIMNFLAFFCYYIAISLFDKMFI